MKKTMTKLIWTCMFCLLSWFMLSEKASAATPQIYTFEPVYKSTLQTYKNMDVTGDKVTDTVKVKFISKANDAMVCKIYVNGKTVFSQKRTWDPSWTIKLLQLENGKVLFDIESTVVSADDGIHCLYIYKKQKLKKIYDFQKYYENYATYYFVDVTEITGNILKARTSSMFYLTGVVNYDMYFSYKNGKVKPITKKFKIDYSTSYNNPSNKWTANRTIKVYKKAGSKKKAFTLKDGDKVKLKRVIYKKNRPYIEVQRTKGKVKKGYIPCGKKYASPSYFDEAIFAG